MIKMGERKLVNRNIVIALAVVCLVLVIGLAFAVTNYTSILSSKDSQIATQNSQIANLQSQITNLTAPNLVWSHFGVTINSGFFMISGFGCNTGTQTAYNVRLNVVAYSVTGTKVIDSYKDLGSIAGKQLVDVSSFRDIYYGGGALNLNWTITPSWTATP